MLLSLGLGAGFCGAMQVPASGLNARSCNVRYCRVSPICAADSQLRRYCADVVVERTNWAIHSKNQKIPNRTWLRNST
jgi:hypothetical protein